MRVGFRKLVFGLLAFVLVVLVVETASFGMLRLAHGRWMTYARVRALQLAVAGEGDAGADAGEEGLHDRNVDLGHQTIHPYLGFVLDVEFLPGLRRKQGGPEALDFGFVLSEPGIFHRPVEGRPVIAITGGSVAFGFGDALRGSVREELLGELPGFEDAVVVNLALPGYKQPQQLLTVSYFLALGAHFDLVLNLDGFNEIALPPAENLPKNVFPFFPRLWSYRTGELDPNLRLVLGEMAFLDDRRRRRAELFAGFPLRHSLTAGLLWTFIDRSLSGSLRELELELRDTRAGEGQRFTTTGPSWEDRGEEAYPELVRFWARASEQLHHLARGRGILYYHFLQPNQYLAGSKPMGEAERRSSLEPGHIYGRHAAKAYPLLIEEGRRLAERGVPFHDLTRIFEAVEEPVYRDSCCHMNPVGQGYLARAIATTIRDDPRRTPR